MKYINAVCAGILILFFATVMFCFAGWRAVIEDSFTGTTYAWTNTAATPVDVKAVLFRHDSAVSNDVSFYVVDRSARAFELENANTNALRYIWVTPTGNGVIRLHPNWILRVVQTATNLAYVVIHPDDATK